MTVLLVHIAYQQDAHSAQQARQFASSALDRRRDTIAKEIKDYAAWGEAYHHLHLRTDINWAFNQSNLGATLYTDLGYDDVLVIGPSGAVTYAVIDGNLASGPSQRLSSSALDALVKAARSAPAGESKPAVGFLASQAFPLLVAATAITAGSDPTIQVTDTGPSVLVFADALTPSRLDEIGRQSLLSALRTLPLAASFNIDRSLVVPTADQKASITLTWDPEQPGQRMLRQVLPWLFAAATAFGALILLVLQRMTRAARRIEVSSHALAEAHRLADHSAHHDGLTHLPNRLMLFRYMQTATEPTSGLQPIAVVYIDLDRFKPINDSLGHRAGDQVLQLTADRLRSVLHSADMAARVGGDEFVIVLTQVDSLGEVEDRCRRIIEVVQEPIQLEGTRLKVGISLGITFPAMQPQEVEELLRRADLAMYQAKAQGGNDFRIYSGEMLAQDLSAAFR